ncbi:MAG: alginate export family protein [Gammaproteobacteria bacterium]|jgi:hypothetical protein|nr:hypothetical protein [Chromatiales bacterium]MDP6675433.1 alginate export family protein [Gammaproteobacteria bacterium]
MNTFTNTENYGADSGRLAAFAMAAVMAFCILAWAPASFAAGLGEDIADTFKNGQFNVNLRYRYEFVDASDNGKKDANASTLRTRLVYKTAKWNDFDITINMDDVHTIVADHYNSTRNGKTQYQTVADPEGTDLNIAALTYSGLENTQIILGRQRIIRGGARFIGNVGWRQNEQTYDALTANYKDDNFKVSYSYVNQVRRIFGPETATGPAADSWDSNSHLLDVSYKFGNALTVGAYGYMMDFDNADSKSNSTYGVRLSGAPKVNDNVTVIYAAEYATQDDYKDNPTDYSADYLLAELGIKWSTFTIKAGYEVLEGDESAGVAFQTPLATLHKFNGWADKFLGTPGSGLEDTYIALSTKVSKGSMALILHDFSSDVGGTDFGQEYDFVAKWPISKTYSVLGKFAIYDADSASSTIDTTKAWLMLTAAF